MIPFRCPHCGLLTNVDDRYAGQSGPCAGCGKRITVPNSPTELRPTAASARSSRLPRGLVAALALSTTVLLLLIAVALMAYLLRPALIAARQNARRAACQRQVERLVQALYAYRDHHGTFPPAYTVDAQGKPLLSWRVLILPYLGPEAAAVHAQLRLDEPWNSAHNSTFHTLVPPAFVCPDDAPFAVGDTSYCVVTGPGYAFHTDKPLDRTDILDDPTHTLLIVEAHGCGINWMAPVDVTSTKLAHGINSGIRGACNSHHTEGVAVVGLADGEARALSDSISPDELHAMGTIDGGELPRPPYVP